MIKDVNIEDRDEINKLFFDFLDARDELLNFRVSTVSDSNKDATDVIKRISHPDEYVSLAFYWGNWRQKWEATDSAWKVYWPNHYNLTY